MIKKTDTVMKSLSKRLKILNFVILNICPKMKFLNLQKISSRHLTKKQINYKIIESIKIFGGFRLACALNLKKTKDGVCLEI